MSNSKKTPAKASKAVKKARTAVSTPTYEAARAIAADSKRSVKDRVAALVGLGRSVCDEDETLQAVLNILRDPAAPLAVRSAALSLMQTASFSAPGFDACRPDYLTALRAVVADPDPEIRQRVLGILSREHDAYAQKCLIEGLRKPDKALVPPEKALQLLSYDVHAEAYPLARDIASNPPSIDAKREALRLLAGDASSAPMFEKVLRDKEEHVEIRQLAASALNLLAPKTLQACAREIMLDTGEDDQIKTTSLTALMHFGEEAAVATDDALHKVIGRLKDEVSSASLKSVARHFLTKYRR